MTERPPFAATLRRAIWPLLVFEAAPELAVLVLFEPLLVLLLERIVALGDDPFVGNAALISFALSPPGMVALATAAIGTILVGVVASGGTSLILWEADRRLPRRHLAVWRSLLGHLPSLLALSAAAFAAVLVLAVPVLGTALAGRRWLLSAGDLYFYLATRPPEFLWATAAIGVTGAATGFAGLILLLRTGLALPICLLRPVSARGALRLAWQTTRGRVRALLPRLLGVAVGLALLWGTFFEALSTLLGWLIARGMSEADLHRAGIGLAVSAALAFTALAAISRGAALLVLLQDQAADAALASRGDAQQAPVRRLGLRLAAMLVLCAAIPAAAAVEVARAGEGAPHAVAITAHRAGSAHAPENTLAALENAIIAGADVVEVDAQETADGEVVLLHDTDLRRVGGVARSIWEMRADELQRLDVGAWFAPGFQGERIPTLRAFAVASRGRVRLNVELKDNRHGEDLAARVVTILRETGVADQAAISSLDLGLLRQVRRMAPEIKLGLIVAIGIGNLGGVDVDFVAIARRLATPAVIRQIATNGREVHVWTLDDDASITRAILYGADNIITGDPLRATRIRNWAEGLTEPERTLLRVAYSLSAGWLRVTGRTELTHGGSRWQNARQLSADDP